MSCIHQAYDLGAAPARYLCSGKKEESYATSIAKTTAAIALLVPGILLAVSSCVLYMLISSCCCTQLKGRITNQLGEMKKIENKSGNPLVSQQRERPSLQEQRENEISLLVNFSPDYWKIWGESLASLEESMEAFKKAEGRILNYFQILSKSGPKSQDDELLREWERRKDAILGEPIKHCAKMNYREYSSFPIYLKESLLMAKVAIRDSIESAEFRSSIAQPTYENRENFLELFNMELNGYYLISSERYFDLFNQEELQNLKPVHQAFCEAVSNVWLAMRDLYAAEKNNVSVAMCERRMATIKTFSDKLQSKIDQRLLSK